MVTPSCGPSSITWVGNCWHCSSNFQWLCFGCSVQFCWWVLTNQPCDMQIRHDGHLLEPLWDPLQHVSSCCWICFCRHWTRWQVWISIVTVSLNRGVEPEIPRGGRERIALFSGKLLWCCLKFKDDISGEFLKNLISVRPTIGNTYHHILTQLAICLCDQTNPRTFQSGSPFTSIQHQL